jgi:hypothetical protein
MSIIEDIEVFRGKPYKYDGYKFYLSKDRYIIVKMCNQQNCCENWSIASTVSDAHILDFIGSKIQNIEMSEKQSEVDYESLNESFVTITTNKGVISIVMSNAHNGYYAHEFIVNYKCILRGKNTQLEIIDRV